MKVFIVEDSDIVVKRLKILLSAFEELEFIGQAANANDAVETILQLKPDVVILDIRLIGGNGMKVLAYQLSISAVSEEMQGTWCGIFF
jgi:DNA-binding NarL/FixJ family response regulator